MDYWLLPLSSSAAVPRRAVSPYMIGQGGVGIDDSLVLVSPIVPPALSSQKWLSSPISLTSHPVLGGPGSILPATPLHHLTPSSLHLMANRTNGMDTSEHFYRDRQLHRHEHGKRRMGDLGRICRERGSGESAINSDGQDIDLQPGTLPHEHLDLQRRHYLPADLLWTSHIGQREQSPLESFEFSDIDRPGITSIIDTCGPWKATGNGENFDDRLSDQEEQDHTHEEDTGERDDSSTSEDGISFQAFFAIPFTQVGKRSGGKNTMENAYGQCATSGQNKVNTELDHPSMDVDESLGSWAESLTNDSLTTYTTQRLLDLQSANARLEGSSIAETISLYEDGFGSRLIRQDHISHEATRTGSVYTESSFTEIGDLGGERDPATRPRRAYSETLQIARHLKPSWLFRKARGFVKTGVALSQATKHERRELAHYDRNAHKSERPCMRGGMADDTGETFDQLSLTEF